MLTCGELRIHLRAIHAVLDLLASRWRKVDTLGSGAMLIDQMLDATVDELDAGGGPCSHLHLHVISADLCSDSMKNKKHYNSFHPTKGYFLHIDDVLSWFDEDAATFKEVRTPLLYAGWFVINSDYDFVRKPSCRKLSSSRC